MQIMIDTAVESPTTLRQYAAMLELLASGVTLLDKVPALTVPEGTVPAAPPPPPFVPPAPIETTSAAPSAAATEQPANTTSIAPSVPVPPPPPPPASIATAAAPSPEAPTTEVAVVAANVQLDKRGFPHDARIHSATPSINKSDDLWRTKRGVANELIETVEAELRAKGYGVAKPTAPTVPKPPAFGESAVRVPGAPVSSLVPPPPPPASTVMVPPPPPVPAPPAGVVAGSNAPASTVMVPPPPGIPAGVSSGTDAGAAAPVDQFRVLMGKLKGQTGEGGPLRREILQPIYAEFGVSGPQDFHKRRDQIPAFIAKIDALLGAS